MASILFVAVHVVLVVDVDAALVAATVEATLRDLGVALSVGPEYR